MGNGSRKYILLSGHRTPKNPGDYNTLSSTISHMWGSASSFATTIQITGTHQTNTSSSFGQSGSPSSRTFPALSKISIISPRTSSHVPINNKRTQENFGPRSKTFAIQRCAPELNASKERNITFDTVFWRVNAHSVIHQSKSKRNVVRLRTHQRLWSTRTWSQFPCWSAIAQLSRSLQYARRENARSIGMMSGYLSGSEHSKGRHPLRNLLGE